RAGASPRIGGLIADCRRKCRGRNLLEGSGLFLLVPYYVAMHRFWLTTLLMFTSSATAVPFGIQVIDEQTSRGVPLVTLETINRVRYVTDSSGFAAIDDPALVDRKVFFTVSSLGYEFSLDSFGSRG